MQSLIKGAVKFMQEDFKEHKKLFKSLKDRQEPHTLFIGCSDSRVIPNLITNTGPGELFVVRNIANIIPPYRVANDYLATTSAIEYAVNALKVRNIIVCGHSNCGGCSALYSSEKELEKVPNVKHWLSMLEDIKNEVLSFSVAQNDEAMRSWLTEKLNLLHSLQNLLTYPGIKEALLEGKMELHAWYYIIETGEIYEYNMDLKNFTLITHKD
ncbi:carbonic anhydrase [Campylobacter sp. MIT 12-8780]|uniref:carbonic anhydrase n=1 Tax=unclassified Campylobacter TaxID=2593542 RepID=UPI0010F6A6D8|nr:MULTISPECIES: carbonic anhydrase [unclassified Campylobacter]NDJ27970.1 carbonic anhydrase [Campylobacter sp. MIT 19-121]TKX29767.1 carbonic anhydrase [Campylobacter sp. MIT 12-5580]TQR40098.1 carbonic anhydrase [Campylobacter sp. MIT 12-8780]